MTPRTLALAIALLATVACRPAGARTLDLSKPEDVIAAEIRLGCAPDPRRPRLSLNRGAVYARRAGEPDRHLFDVIGFTTRACEIVSDAKRGPGYRSVGREIMFFLDPATGAILDEWRNPWTGETVEVLHMLNDPTNAVQPRFAYGADGRPEARWTGEIVGGFAIRNRRQPFFRDNPMGGDWQDYVGGKYHVLELSTDVIPAGPWLDTRVAAPPRGASSWTRIGPWLPWMKMGGREGGIVIHSAWTEVGSLDEVPEPARGAIRARFPQFTEAPAFDDRRPFVNSWVSYQQQIDRRRGQGAERPREP